MAGYARKSLQIVGGGGGLNLLAPTDKVPITDFLLAQNFRSDSLGRLICRPGYLAQFSIAGGGIAHSAGSMGGAASPYFVGTNNGISNPTGSLYYGGAFVATGFDGNRLGFASQNGMMWVMNRGAQGRYNPVAGSASSGWFPYGLTPPPASPAGVGVSTPASVTSVTYGYAPVGNSNYLHFLTIAGMTYSLVEDGITDPDAMALQIALLAGADPNCSVTYPGTGNLITVAPILTNLLIPVSASDGNGPANLLISGTPVLPNGTYQFYLTFQSTDFSVESNPSPPSRPVVVVNGAINVTIPALDAPTDVRVGFINIYATGGTLSAAYRVGQIAAGPAPVWVSTAGYGAGSWAIYAGVLYTALVNNTGEAPATSPGYWVVTAFQDTIPDLQATQNGIVMSIVNGLPPACAGIIGPQFAQLMAFSTVANPNRVYYTQPDLPQYWNTDPQVGDFFDVGLSGEAIVWATIHVNLTVFYKERSIWILIGSPLTGQLEQVYDGAGLCGQFALASAGQVDYYISANGLCLFDMTESHVLSGNILPLFNQNLANSGPLTTPGSVLPGSFFNSTSTACYAIALGHAMGRLYIAYAENSLGSVTTGGPDAGAAAAYNLLVFDEGPEPERNAYLASQRPGRWFYHRNAIANTVGGFFGFFFDGTNMIGLSGVGAGAAQGFSLADFRTFAGTDPGNVPITCVYQSHFEDCGMPQIPKVWLEVVIDIETIAVGGTIYVAFNNGVGANVQDSDEPPNSYSPALTAIGGFGTTARRSISYALPGGGIEALNMSVALLANAAAGTIIHNVYLYYYEEARLAILATTLPSDLGIGKVKQCKELQLDVDATGGTVAVTIMSDLPGNQLLTRQSPVVLQNGRGVFKYPFAITEGFLWKLIFYGPGTFRLYSARLLMRVLGVFVEGYESVAGFLWDSMQQDLGNPGEKTFDALRFEMDADGPVSVTMFTDLPGEQFAARGTFVLATAATTRAWVTVPLPPNGAPNAGPIEGRGIQLQVLGPSAYRLYSVQARWSKLGRYLCALPPNGLADAFNTLEFDYESERRKMFKRIEIDLRADGVVNMSVITDQDGDKLAAVYAPQLVTPNGRTTVLVAMPPGVRGRLMRVLLSGPAPARIYKIRVWCRTVGDDKAAWEWQEFPLEASDVLPAWSNLIVAQTSPEWELVDVPFEVTEG